MAGPTGNVVQETAAPGSKAPAASLPGAADQAPGRERSPIGACLLELSICLILGFASLAVVASVVATGWIAYLDGIALALIGLTLGAFFLFDLAWSLHTGELEALLKELRKGPS
ncbi:MAG: hypothetical protein DMG26_03280 [Acidobacteria bacterium]|nr:MAG: hypothetical protein DMG26_03280 [Acidobacteriota bacterium]